jgi:hypothetical protein
MSGLTRMGVGEVGAPDSDPRLASNTLAAALNEGIDCQNEIDRCFVPSYMSNEGGDTLVEIANSELVGARLVFSLGEFVVKQGPGGCECAEPDPICFVEDSEIFMLSDWDEEYVGSFSSGDDITELQEEQLLVGARTFEPNSESAGDAFAMSDEGDIRLDILTHLPSGARYESYGFYSGDTKVGFVFVEGTMTLAAENSDGAFLCESTCEP